VNNLRSREVTHIAILGTGYWHLPPLLGALPLGFNFKISLKVSFKNKMNAKNIFANCTDALHQKTYLYSCSLFSYMSITNLNIKNRSYDMYNLAEFLTSVHMDVVTESSGDLFNVHIVLILEFDHACNTVHGRIQYKL
jgi:hypothetical protein